MRLLFKQCGHHTTIVLDHMLYYGKATLACSTGSTVCLFVCLGKCAYTKRLCPSSSVCVLRQSLLTLGIAGLIAHGSAALIPLVGVPTIAMLSRGARH